MSTEETNCKIKRLTQEYTDFKNGYLIVDLYSDGPILLHLFNGVIDDDVELEPNDNINSLINQARELRNIDSEIYVDSHSYVSGEISIICRRLADDTEDFSTHNEDCSEDNYSHEHFEDFEPDYDSYYTNTAEESFDY